MLSADPARRCLLRWEALDSAPPAKAGELHSDPRYVAQQQRLEMMVKHAHAVQHAFRTMPYVPLAFITAKTGRNGRRLWKAMKSAAS